MVIGRWRKIDAVSESGDDCETDSWTDVEGAVAGRSGSVLGLTMAIALVMTMVSR